MADISKRFYNNPILFPKEVLPSASDLQIVGLFNPGVFYFQEKIWMIVRVAENLHDEAGVYSYVSMNHNKLEVFKRSKQDPNLDSSDARVHKYKGVDYLTSISHFRLFCSSDGYHFSASALPLIKSNGPYETYGIEDCRVSKIDDLFYQSYTAVSENGVGVGLRTTRDWVNFEFHGLIFPPHNKDCAIFENQINGKFYAFHRPSSVSIGGNYIWLSESPDGIHWGKHQCIVKTRFGMWDSQRVGAGAAPIKTSKGWLAIYHGANLENIYCLGAVLLDLLEPWKVLARSVEPIMIPSTPYEQEGFFNNVVFTNGHYWDGESDEIKVYYGAADKYICGAEFSISRILESLKSI